jgi:tetratricopeptide (TPR) repeat protein
MAGRIGIMSRLMVAAFLMWIGGGSFAHAEKRVALVIGNSAYRAVPALPNPKADATLIADTLSSLGFAVVGGGAQLDLDKAGFDEALRKFGTALTGADVALFYYAGHGVETHGLNYLVPVDAHPADEGDVFAETTGLAGILAAMEKSGARVNLVLLDACRDNPFRDHGVKSATGGLAQMQAPVGTLISFATQPRSVALDGDDGHSPYTKALAMTMKQPGFGLFKTFNEVGLAVEKATNGEQLPWVSSSPISGNFYFAGKPATLNAWQPLPPSDPAAPAPPLQQARLSSPDDPLRRDLITDCDRLAGMPYDTGHAAGVAGVEINRMNVAAAAAACNDALARYPDVARFTFEAGRVATARKDYAEAARWYGKAVAAGEPIAMVDLGWQYEHGHGVAKDLAEARRLYQAATDAGVADGMNNLGLLYLRGTGVSRDYAQARRLFEQGASLGNAAAINGLGVIYSEGDGVPRNLRLARERFEKARQNLREMRR